MAAAQQRMPLWAAEAEIDEDLHDVDLNLAIGNYGQNMYDGPCPPHAHACHARGLTHARTQRTQRSR
jgi:phosphatidylethanolamine-binding protein (PEBP) family uncharacterized protein